MKGCAESWRMFNHRAPLRDYLRVGEGRKLRNARRAHGTARESWSQHWGRLPAPCLGPPGWECSLGGPQAGTTRTAKIAQD